MNNSIYFHTQSVIGHKLSSIIAITFMGSSPLEKKKKENPNQGIKFDISAANLSAEYFFKQDYFGPSIFWCEQDLHFIFHLPSKQKGCVYYRLI
jgi:hypothetical protein